jgi:deoxyribose-phosphate aldolase
MEIIYSCYDIAVNEEELKNNISNLIKLDIRNIACFPFYAKCSKAIEPTIKTFCAIDYPFGIQDLKSRISSAEYAIKCGADVIEVAAPTYFLCNRKYDKFREDIKQLVSLCSEHKVYRFFGWLYCQCN